ncbi:polysaccharide deacetylase family protein [Streptomyces sp. SID4919]|uniref:polysaccharide deacetylase family protein n=1 Tax=unclassified Streptomyces TaxID=2593676 RepID=UPI000823E26E|nr:MULTISPECIES: polysaccharide deacetylase family protein [unclassified Streptomyces]MYY13443.1 polysaccharide deacetylase family protein [Streptomyces sp. SID4919]SCK61359.1 Peptidoglycan/xylan/chitin deacetylase, PgdA/CDA1 family [Streptomyces sp. AmelKG-E11A]
MLYAGIAWSADGYDVEVIDSDGHRATAPTHWGAERTAELTAWLGAPGPSPEPPRAVVVESTNGLVDGLFTAAGLTVYRADPWVLPERPDFGSVPALALAERARTDLASLSPLTAEGGGQTGRDDDYHGGIRRSAAIEDELTRAGRWFRHGARDRHEIALTFDDGPDRVYTGQVLDILARYGVHATFFCVGLHVNALPDEVRRIVDAGHSLGNHTWSHPFMPDLSPRQFRLQLERTDDAFDRAVGRVPTVFRPPYGSRTPETLGELLPGGPALALWDVDSWDWARPGPEKIASTVLDHAGPGSLILMHDGGGDRRQSVAALPAVIEGLLERDLRFVAADALLAGARARSAVAHLGE